MTDEVNGFYKGQYIDLEIVVKGLSFFIDSPEAHMCYAANSRSNLIALATCSFRRFSNHVAQKIRANRSRQIIEAENTDTLLSGL